MVKKVKKSLNFPVNLQPTLERGGRYFFTDVDDSFPVPNLIEVQLQSYRWFLEKGLHELINEVSPIVDATGKKLRLDIMEINIEDPKHDIETCRAKGLTYESIIRAHVSLTNLETGEIKEQDVYFGQIPRVTPGGSFLINGVERIIVNQITRSPGIFYSASSAIPGNYQAKMIPRRGAWLEVESDKRGAIWVKVDRKRKMPVTMFIRAFGYDTDEKIRALFADVAKGLEEDPLAKTFAKDDTTTEREAWQGVYRRIRPGDLATPDNARNFIYDLFHNQRKYDLGPIARYKINQRFGTTVPKDENDMTFRIEDFISLVRGLIEMNSGEGVGPDDIDHLSNRRIRGVGELIQTKFRVGLLRTERIIRDRMSIVELDTVTPTQIVNCRPVTAAMHEFFASSQLSQFMDQTNPLAELEHKRRISAMGPGGLTRERASFEVRDVHPSHFGRICPVTTPEGPNIGLVLHLATYARVNEMGFIETPYRVVRSVVKNDGKAAVGRRAGMNIVLKGKKKPLVERGEIITEDMAAKIAKEATKTVAVWPHVTTEVNYYDAEEEKTMCVAQGNTKLNEIGELLEESISARNGFAPGSYPVDIITHIDVSPKQIVSLSTSMISFLEHDDNTRALMGSNMQRQAVPLIKPDSPIVGTGMEATTSVSQTIRAPEAGEVKSVDANHVTFVGKSGQKYHFDLTTFKRTNQSTCLHQKPVVDAGEKVKQGDVLVDGSAVDNGETALGQNLIVAYMSWSGYNYEDAVIVSDRVVREGLYNSIHIEKYEMDVRETKLGPEEMTADIPNVGAHRLKDLDEEGIIRIGSTVLAGDILAGKVTPKGESELTAEDRLLRAIFGEKAHDVKDTSQRLPRGSGGKVIDVQVLDRSKGDDLPTSVLKRVQIKVAQMRHLEIGDKMAGRHGNKGVISRIVPSEDMPYLEDGTPVDIILNPLGVSSRMNIGQVLETHLGIAAKKMGIKIATPALSGIKTDMIQDFLKSQDLPEDGKFQLYDGRTGDKFSHKTVVGVTYMLKLIHLVEDKVHARSVGPYSLVTQQPFGGKAQNGGQRFGEMEVWALEAYGAAHTLQEMLTIKSDDVHGRAKAYESIVKQEPIDWVSIPESFNVLIKELQSLGLKVELLQDGDVVDDMVLTPETKEEEKYQVKEDALHNEVEEIVSSLGAVEGTEGAVSEVDETAEEPKSSEE